MKSSTVLISGASIAGPALAYWLARHGFRPTVVELAPALRSGGNRVDFRGQTHLGVLERMGVLDDLRKVQTGGTAMRFVDAKGRKLMEVPADFAGGDIEVPRFDLSRVLYEQTRNSTDYLFGDSIAAMTDTSTGVDVTFTSGIRRTFDLVIGADGVHSAVRRLAFGPEEGFVRHLGYYVATWEMPNDLGLSRHSLLHNSPGRMASIGGDHRDPSRAGAFVVFAAPPLDYDRHEPDQQRGIIGERFADMGWEVPRLLAGLRDTPHFYFDSICRVDVPTWSRGRIALVGDAACGATLGAMGTGTAIVAAYALAGELAAADGDHTVAFPRYERLLADFARRCQKGGDTTGRFFAPRTAVAARWRNRLLNQPFLMAMMLRTAEDRSTNIELPSYP
ncbi:FAD-dependent monooxygenase [Micromonospora sp. RTGN7]|uniref:FAD-dependent monooxygenase n=1 Tax=Micromonospora sp. RTGN7 TaxID=3016526 RepID=UPI0029FEE024|nr:FAD-dependent monooxygenase [Micromonospora sp. RTGN7]